MAKGLYHRKLIRIFVSIAILFIILFTVLFCVLSISLLNSRNAAIRASIQSQFTLARTSLSVINNTLNNLVGSSTTANWANEQPLTNEYYYRSLKLYQELRHLTSQLDGREYEIIITSTEQDAFVITKNGTRPKQWYFENEAPIPWETASNVYQFFTTNKGALLLPIYDHADTLETIAYVLKGTYYGHDLIFFVFIPAQTLFQNVDSMPFFLLGPNGSRIYSENTEDSKALVEQISQAFPDDWTTIDGRFKTHGHTIYIDRISYMGILLGFIDTTHASTELWMVLLLGGIPLLAICALFAATYLTKHLYAPIDEAIDTSSISLLEFDQDTTQEAVDDTSSTKPRTAPVDEFAVIKHMGSRIKELTEELLDITSKQQDHPTQQNYRLLLAGTTPENTQDTDHYAVALFELEESPTDGYSYSLISLQANASLLPDIECIPLTPSLNALIFRFTTDGEDPHTLFMQHIKTLLDELHGDDEVKVAVSDMVTGKHNIYRAYRQAQVILEYKHLYPGVEILTKEYISSSHSENYYYPAAMEQTFITYTLNGSQNAIALFDEIVHENTEVKQLSGPNYQNFMFVLFGTFLHIFQELKTSPEQLCGTSLDWLDLYSQWHKPEALDTLRSTLVQIVDAVQVTSSAEDDKLLEKMKAYIHTHYMYDIMLQDLAQKCNITPKYCSTLFKKLSNDTFKNYLNQYRVEQACLRIKQNPQIKINELSLDMGFNSATSFIRVFNKYTGISPKAYADKIVTEEG